VAAPRKKKEAKKAKTAANNDLGDDNRTWATKEIECLLCIMKEMLEELNSISKIKIKKMGICNKLPLLDNICN
jgi:uncharacterized membrane protein YqiK